MSHSLQVLPVVGTSSSGLRAVAALEVVSPTTTVGAGLRFVEQVGGQLLDQQTVAMAEITTHFTYIDMEEMGVI
jgi:hypothetical protein